MEVAPPDVDGAPGSVVEGDSTGSVVDGGSTGSDVDVGDADGVGVALPHDWPGPCPRGGAPSASRSANDSDTEAYIVVRDMEMLYHR